MEEQQPLRNIGTRELSLHNKPDDLWLAIEGYVYDVTQWKSIHPGGDLPLLDLAGQDVTDAFLAYHPGTAWQYLKPYKIGVLEDSCVSEVSQDYRRLLQDLKVAGMFKNTPKVYISTFLFMSALFALCVMGVLLSDKMWVHVLSAVLLGAFWAQSAFIGHDSGHCGITGNSTIDKYIQLLVGNGLTGISIGWWKRSHNVHHIACNNLEYDPDVQYVPLFAVSSKFFGSLHSYFYDRKMSFDRLARFFVSYQHWTFYPVMAFARVNLYCQSFSLVLDTKKRVAHRFLEILGLIAFWIWFPLLISFLPHASKAVFVFTSFAVCGIQHVQFCLNHFPAEMYVGKPESNLWFELQTKGTIDISCSPWMDWFHGGLQFQLEHHLFPRLPRCHLRQIKPLVKALCAKHGLPYTSVGFWRANKMLVGALRNAAMDARDLSKPLDCELLWDGLNARG